MTRLAPVIAMLAACSAPPRPPADVIRSLPATTEEAVLGRTIAGTLRAATAAALGAPRQVGAAVLLSTGVCASRVGAPMLYLSSDEPRVGYPFRAEFTTLPLGAPREWPAFVLLMLDREPIDFDASLVGMPGCHLYVDLGAVTLLVPGADPSNLLHRPGGDSGRVVLNWTPSGEWAGRVLVMQCAVLCPPDVAAAGVMVSPALVVRVGR